VNIFLPKIVDLSDIYFLREMDAYSKWWFGPVLFRPIWRFIRTYIIRFQGGFPGLFVAISTAFATLFKHCSPLYESRSEVHYILVVIKVHLFMTRIN